MLKLTRPSLEGVIHPSLSEGPIEPNLPISLSGYEFRAYRDGAGFVVMHHRSLLLISSTVGFSLDGYFQGLTGSLLLPEQAPYVVEELAFSVDLAFPYDNNTMVHDFWITLRPGLRDIPPCVGRLQLQIDLNIHGAPFRGRLDHAATVVRRYRRY